ncbi:MAG TPA: hypothetical protein VIO58_12355 [Candidatus Methanoperedens sp.]
MELRTIKKIHVLPFAQAVGATFAALGFFISIPTFFLAAIPESPSARLEALGWIILVIAPHVGGIRLEVE